MMHQYIAYLIGFFFPAKYWYWHHPKKKNPPWLVPSTNPYFKAINYVKSGSIILFFWSRSHSYSTPAVVSGSPWWTVASNTTKSAAWPSEGPASPLYPGTTLWTEQVYMTFLALELKQLLLIAHAFSFFFLFFFCWLQNLTVCSSAMVPAIRFSARPPSTTCGGW